MKKILIIPAYNEEANILNVCKTIEIYNEENEKKLDYIIINDESKDDTLKILKENNLNYVDLISNLGIGGAVQTGYKYALKNDYDIAIQFDGDGQHDINYVEKLCKEIESGESDMCIGSRYLDDSTSSFKSTFMRRIGKNIISVFIKLLCGKKITDPTSGFRAVNKEIIGIFAKEYPREYPEPESIVSLNRRGYKIKEVPVSMNERTAGQSSINPFKSVKYMITVVFMIISMVKIIKKRKIEGTLSLFWVISGFVLCIAIIFPQAVVKIAHFLGFEAASNMIFVIAIFTLFYKVFNLTLHISKQQSENVKLVQEISILKKKVEEIDKEK